MRLASGVSPGENVVTGSDSEEELQDGIEVLRSAKRGAAPDQHAVHARVTFPMPERDRHGRYRTPSFKIPVVLSIQGAHGAETSRVSVDRYVPERPRRGPAT